MILAVTVLPEALPTSSLEVHGGCVKEDQPDFAEQIAPPIKERLFHQILRAAGSSQDSLSNLLTEPRHGPVEMLEVQLLCPGNAIVLLPRFGGPIAARGKKPVEHRQIKRPFQVKAVTPLGGQPANDLCDAHLLPQPPEDQLRPDLHDGHRLGLSGGMSVEHLDLAAIAQPAS